MNTQGGLIKLIILIILAIAVLSYLGFDLKTFVNSPVVQGNFGFVFNFVGGVWQNYLAGPASYLWNDIFIKLLWNSFTENLQRIKDGRPNTIQENYVPIGQ